MFKIEGATGGYGKTTIIPNINIEVNKNEVVALLGRNGVGKSTLMKYAMGLIPAMNGVVTIEGKQAPMAPAKRARAGLGYVPQGRFVFSRMTVTENIAVAAASNGYEPVQAVARLFEDFPMLIQKANDLAGGLSGGQQQVLALARALATRPRILLLDEPTEGVQPSIIDEISCILKRISKEFGISILVAEQNLDFCLSIAERAYIMEKGTVRVEIDKESLRADKNLQQELLGV